MEKNKNKVSVSLLFAKILIFLGLALGGYFTAIGGPNKGKGAHLLNNSTNLYLDIQVALSLIGIGIVLVLFRKVTDNINNVLKTLKALVTTQLILLAFALVWGLLTMNSLAAVLSAFVLFLEIPLVFLVLFVALVGARKVEYPVAYRIAILVNIFALGLMILNVTT